jgi:trehalose 6-phosphate synthase/phosphatase
MSRIVLVSNRLPVTVSSDEQGLRVDPSSGGLATGLSGPHARGDSSWIGWPGKSWTLSEQQRSELDQKLAELRLSPIHLSEEDVRHYYEGFSNGVLWPLFHYMMDKIPLQALDWDAYERVNAKFADEVAKVSGPDDVIWIHDYQLLLLPQMLRERLPNARIGFFLHIPFPASAVLRTLPFRERILQGMLGADLIGFHTHSYVRHFVASILRVLGLETLVDIVRHDGRETRIGSFPMGIDARAFSESARSPSVQARAQEMRGDGSCRLLLGIDRLDYTKGIARRLMAFEQLLHDAPELHGSVRLIQVAVPSRSTVRAYRDQRDLVNSHVGRINGVFGSATWTPVHYMHRSLEREEVIALYAAADVMLVTPIRDGMNLVAKEFVASRVDEDGVLVLSEFAGAAAELDGAVQINPYDVAATGQALYRALQLPREDRRLRMRKMRERVLRADARAWAESFLGELQSHDEQAERAKTSATSPAKLEAEVERLRRAEHVVMLLDYDGSLVPFTPMPSEARPDAQLIELLLGLAQHPRYTVHLVSGRARENMDAWFGSLGIALHAEHGLWSRVDHSWRRLIVPDLPYAAHIKSILDEFAARTPGSHVEAKSSVVAFHWRNADPVFGMRQANELRLHLAELLSNVSAEVVAGNHVIEVRPFGLHKGVVVPAAIEDALEGTLVLALGDDRTDEDMFAVLPKDSVALHVGARPSVAALRVDNPAQARAFLARLL